MGERAVQLHGLSIFGILEGGASEERDLTMKNNE